jgi:translation elongation factor EF-4
VIFVQIDLPAAQPERIVAQIESTFGLNPEEVLRISAKSGEGVQAVLETIVKRIPPPAGDAEKPLKAFLFDSSSVRIRVLLGRGAEPSVGMTVIGGSFH